MAITNGEVAVAIAEIIQTRRLTTILTFIMPAITVGIDIDIGMKYGHRRRHHYCHCLSKLPIKAN